MYTLNMQVQYYKRLLIYIFSQKKAAWIFNIFFSNVFGFSLEKYFRYFLPNLIYRIWNRV